MMRSMNFGKLGMAAALALLATSFTVRAQERPEARQSNSPASAEFSMRALKSEPGMPSLYEVRFTTADTIDPQAELVFEFPAVLDLHLLEIASSTTINGGFTILRERNVVRVRRTGLGTIVLPGRPVELKLGLITNPPALPANLEVGFTQLRASRQTAAAKKSYPIQFVPKTNQ